MSNIKRGEKATITTGLGINKSVSNSLGILEISGPALTSITQNYSQYSFYNSNVPQLTIGATDIDGIIQIGVKDDSTSFIQSSINNNTRNLILQHNGGYVGIGTYNSKCSLHIHGTDALIIPVGTTQQRPSQLKPGMIRYNTTINKFEGYYQSNTWKSLVNIIDSDGDTYIKVQDTLTSTNNDIQFFTNGNKKFLIKHSGDVLIGDDMTSNTLLTVNGDIKLSHNVYNNEIPFIENIDTGDVNMSYLFKNTLFIKNKDKIGINCVPDSKFQIFNYTTPNISIYGNSNYDAFLYIGKDNDNGLDIRYENRSNYESFKINRRYNGNDNQIINHIFASGYIELHGKLGIKYSNSTNQLIVRNSERNLTNTHYMSSTPTALFYSGLTDTDILWTGPSDHSEGIYIGASQISKYGSGNLYIKNMSGNIQLNAASKIQVQYNRDTIITGQIDYGYLDQLQIRYNAINVNHSDGVRFQTYNSKDIVLNSISGTTRIGTTITNTGYTHKLAVGGRMHVRGSLYIDNTSNNYGGEIRFGKNYGEANVNHAYIKVQKYANTEDSELYIRCNNRVRFKAGEIRFDTLASNTTSRTGTNTRMIITSDGRVGIGDTDPAYALEIAGDIFMSHYTDHEISLTAGSTNVTSSDDGTIAFLRNTVHASTRSTSENNMPVAAHSDGKTYVKSSYGIYLRSTTFADYNASMYFGSNGIKINGSTNPRYPLEVYGTARRVYNDAGYSAGPGSFIFPAFGNDAKQYGSANGVAVKFYSSYNIFSKTRVAASDIRIKQSIMDVPDNVSLNKVRNIDVKFFNYITPSVGSTKTVGFIAQEVKEVCPSAVQYQNEFIPTINKQVYPEWEVIYDTSNNKKYKMRISDVSDIDINDLSANDLNIYKFYVSDDISSNNSRNIVKYIKMNIDNTFTFEKKWNHVFCYGKKVSDYHSLNHETLFCINFSATQEIDRKQQNEIQRLRAATSKLSEVESIIEANNNEIVELEKEINRLFLEIYTIENHILS
jgi:hypothetical protein